MIFNLNGIDRVKMEGQSIDVMPYISRCLLDVIGLCALGIHLKAQEEPDNEYLKALVQFGKSVTVSSSNLDKISFGKQICFSIEQ